MTDERTLTEEEIRTVWAQDGGVSPAARVDDDDDDDTTDVSDASDPTDTSDTGDDDGDDA